MKKTLTSMAAAGIIAAASTASLDNTVLVQEEFTAQLANMVKQDQDAITAITVPFERQMVVISSPGGNSSSLDVINALLQRSTVGVDTQVAGHAASAAAVLFTLGKTRVMAPTDEIMFHRVRIMLGGSFLNPGRPFTAQDFEDLLLHKKLLRKDATAEDLKVGLKALKEIPEKDLRELIASMRRIDLKMIQNVAKNLNLSETFVATNICKNNEDTTFTGEEAFKLGIATDLKVPHFIVRALRGLGLNV